ncbi:MAG TPA: hypothetical protein VGS01_02770 [Candidatus Limnocylindria bacterium]|nr:hypothetical protein [Candidatus Limnocylindria bacterium]
MSFLVGLIVGVALALVVLGFLAIGSYGRGYEDAEMRRREWRAELATRRSRLPAAAIRAHA